MQEISREYYLAHSGHKSTAELQPIYARHAPILGPDALAMVLEAFRASAAGSEEQRSTRLLLDWLAESQSARELAPVDERQIAWEATAVVHVSDTKVIPYESVAIEIANNTDRAQRHAIEAARAALVARELAPLRKERFERERDITEQLGLASSYNATFELVSGIDLEVLKAECEQFLRDTNDMWRDVVPEFTKRVLGMEPSQVIRADALALFRGRDFDAYFPPERMESSIRRQVKEMGVDPLANGRIRLDTSEREGKRSRAFCAPVRVPDEVYLVLRPHGGQTDWSTFLHELGHALHFAYARPDYPFEYRWLGDNSVTESYAMLFDHHMDDAGWLKRYTELNENNLQRFRRSAGFEELHYIRRYCAKLIYETQLYRGDLRWESLPDLYVDTLTTATNFQYSRSEAFVDVDPHFYSARYLRAWQLQALLSETLTQRFDEDWWRNPRAGPWIVQSLFSEGQRELAHEQAARVADRELSFGPLVRRIEALLG